MAKANSPNSETTTGTTTGYESELWKMADALRGSMDAAEYKHVALGLIFLKYISDAFEERQAAVLAEWGEDAAEDQDEYIAENIFWVPPEARWQHLKSQTRQPTIGRLIDDAMIAIERDNPALKDVLPKDYARPALDKSRLGQVVDMVSNIKVGGAEARATDVLGNVYEYFLEHFAIAEGRKGGEFYTPRSVVRLLVEMLEPYKGRVYDPCCGSSGMFVQSVEFIRAHVSGNGNVGKAKGDISIYGQESNYTTWRMARMNLAIRASRGRSSTATASTTTVTRTCGPTTSSPIHPSISPTGEENGCVTTGGGSMAFLRWVMPTSPGCSIFCITLRHGARQVLSLLMAPCRRTSPAKERFAITL